MATAVKNHKSHSDLRTQMCHGQLCSSISNLGRLLSSPGWEPTGAQHSCVGPQTDPDGTVIRSQSAHLPILRGAGEQEGLWAPV